MNEPVSGARRAERTPLAWPKSHAVMHPTPFQTGAKSASHGSPDGNQMSLDGKEEKPTLRRLPLTQCIFSFSFTQSVKTGIKSDQCKHMKKRQERKNCWQWNTHLLGDWSTIFLIICSYFHSGWNSRIFCPRGWLINLQKLVVFKGFTRVLFSVLLFVSELKGHQVRGPFGWFSPLNV